MPLIATTCKFDLENLYFNWCLRNISGVTKLWRSACRPRFLPTSPVQLATSDSDIILNIWISCVIAHGPTCLLQPLLTASVACWSLHARPTLPMISDLCRISYCLTGDPGVTDLPRQQKEKSHIYLFGVAGPYLVAHIWLLVRKPNELPKRAAYYA
jgi:hypothetical protein